ncbi:hypothetical protein FIBSPDRAFT_950617 [Athelia psychrophila]|uniref:Uncharacterized protein n=1 Tax=Athelia psychrophila TaxID=1759441 RepID=A0A166NPX6_9AGAM|nr:hypothetical protein FIBSPDRAFT_950617 [Fibularhizoctonia sp. CBS 109695]
MRASSTASTVHSPVSGPGRAVLSLSSSGCGLGVLLCMLFVLVVIAVRTVKGGNASDEEVEYRGITLVTGATEAIAAPPQYASSKVSARSPRTTTASASFSSVFTGLFPAARGVPQIEVTFDMEALNILDL